MVKIIYFQKILAGICLLCLIGTTPQSDNPKSGDSQTVAYHSIQKIYTELNSGLMTFSPRIIFQDKQGAYWFAKSWVVQKFEERTNRWDTFSNDPNDSDRIMHVQGNAIFPYPLETIAQSKDNFMWFSSKNKSYGSPLFSTFFDGKTWQKKIWIIEKSESRSIGLFSNKEGKIHFWYGNKLASYDGRWTPPVQIFEKPTPENLQSLYVINCGLQDKDGLIWLGTNLGLFTYDEGTKKAWGNKETENIKIREVYEDQEGKLWFSDYIGNIYAYNKKAKSIKRFTAINYIPESLIDNPMKKFFFSINSIYQDKNGRFLFATDVGLLTFLERENKWELFTKENSDLPNNIITIIYEDRQGRIWLGTEKEVVVLEK